MDHQIFEKIVIIGLPPNVICYFDNLDDKWVHLCLWNVGPVSK
jgi:hypothetical protein